MGKVPFWADSPFPWQQVRINGETLPGIATVTGDVGRKVDTAQAPGNDGGTFTHLGYEPAEVEVKLVLATPEHLEAFTRLAPTIRPRKGEKSPKPVNVYHPALELLGIRSLFLMKIGIPEPGSVKGTYEVKLGFAEFIPEYHRNTRTTTPTTTGGAKTPKPKQAPSKPTAQDVRRPSQQGPIPFDPGLRI